jgi:hypothetical protein
MGNVDKVDRTLPLNEMIYHVRRDPCCADVSSRTWIAWAASSASRPKSFEEAGSGGTAELLAWLAVLPFTVGGADILGYTPSTSWRTGTGFVAWPVGSGS